MPINYFSLYSAVYYCILFKVLCLKGKWMILHFLYCNRIFGAKKEIIRPIIKELYKNVSRLDHIHIDVKIWNRIIGRISFVELNYWLIVIIIRENWNYKVFVICYRQIVHKHFAHIWLPALILSFNYRIVWIFKRQNINWWRSRGFSHYIRLSQIFFDKYISNGLSEMNCFRKL